MEEAKKAVSVAKKTALAATVIGGMAICLAIGRRSRSSARTTAVPARGKCRLEHLLHGCSRSRNRNLTSIVRPDLLAYLSGGQFCAVGRTTLVIYSDDREPTDRTRITPPSAGEPPPEKPGPRGRRRRRGS